MSLYIKLLRRPTSDSFYIIFVSNVKINNELDN